MSKVIKLYVKKHVVRFNYIKVSTNGN